MYRRSLLKMSSIVPWVNGDLPTTCRTVSMLISGIGIGLVAAGKDIPLAIAPVPRPIARGTLGSLIGA